MTEPRCDLCGAEPATVRFTEVDEGRVTKRTICRNCARTQGLLDEPPVVDHVPDGIETCVDPLGIVLAGTQRRW